MNARKAVAGYLSRKLRFVVSSLLGVTLSFGVWANASFEKIEFNISKQPLHKALLVFSEQAKVQLILAADTNDMAPCPEVIGTLTAREALEMLINGAGLEYHFSSSNTVTITKVKDWGTLERNQFNK